MSSTTGASAVGSSGSASASAVSCVSDTASDCENFGTKEDKEWGFEKLRVREESEWERKATLEFALGAQRVLEKVGFLASVVEGDDVEHRERVAIVGQWRGFLGVVCVFL